MKNGYKEKCVNLAPSKKDMYASNTDVKQKGEE
jgi:hypothetical protein